MKEKIDVTQKEINNILPENVSILNNFPRIKWTEKYHYNLPK